MNSVSVPVEYKHMLTREYKTTDDCKAQIRRFIDDRPGEALTNHDFQGLLSTTSAMAHVKRLMKQGYVTRSRVHKGKGKRFSYKWHEAPLDFETALSKNGFVVTHDMALPELPTIDNIRDMYFDFARRGIGMDALQFVFHIEDKIKEVKKQREEVINAHIERAQ
jgi:hypothetical protein